MYYIWKLKKTGKPDYFDCGIEQFEGWETVPWMFAEKITFKLPEILNYYTDSKVLPGDYPRVGSTEFLISKKIYEIFNRLNIDGIDYYKSRIIAPNKIFDDYYTANILNIVDCFDEGNSIFRYITPGESTMRTFKKISIHEEKIPDNIKLFRIKRLARYVIVNEEIKDTFETEHVTGVNFLPIGFEQESWLTLNMR